MRPRSVGIRVWRADDDPCHRVLPGSTEEALPIEPPLDAFELFQQMRHAGCSENERRAVMLWLMYRSLPRVAREMNLPKARVLTILVGVRNRMAAWRHSRPRPTTRGEVLAVYAQEVSRRGYVAEHHCPPGQEECRDTGRCTRRWYLFRDPGV